MKELKLFWVQLTPLRTTNTHFEACDAGGFCKTEQEKYTSKDNNLDRFWTSASTAKKLQPGLVHRKTTSDWIETMHFNLFLMYFRHLTELVDVLRFGSVLRYVFLKETFWRNNKSLPYRYWDKVFRNRISKSYFKSVVKLAFCSE